ncbi:phosphatidylinositol glycan anchor biosynthesis class M [Anticarsia gemmatalis]|uniref:phosphatidylinositol glycan anchor biosynthesis class M n=1 Tax=Anticarsia gemmatalis TaxID=129554 RepID=UPI003F760F31
MPDVSLRRTRNFIDLPFKFHLAAGTVVRLLLIAYAHYHDQMYELQYTDVDYKVFTDAARHVVNGESPYRRHTYRYSPLIAIMLTPNIFLHKDFGKVLFSFFDILISIASKKLVERQLFTYGLSKVPSYCAQLWIYNPMSIAITTRGNADSVSCFFIIMSLYFLRINSVKNHLLRFSLAGFFLGLSIHLRLYPLAFSFPMFLSLGAYDTITPATSVLHGLWLLLPNRRQMYLTLSTIVTIIGLTYGMYVLYGYEFLFETYLYHLFRRDTRHNFSILFYYSYLTMDEVAIDIVKVIVQISEVIILFAISLTFGVRANSLPFALFCQAVVMVAFNSVMTSQYFIWFLSLLPLVAHCFKIHIVNAFFLALAWVTCQGAWLFYAYMLEFRGQEVFFYIWMKSVFFFASHIYVLAQLIKTYRLGYGFGLIDNATKVGMRRKAQ